MGAGGFGGSLRGCGSLIVGCGEQEGEPNFWDCPLVQKASDAPLAQRGQDEYHGIVLIWPRSRVGLRALSRFQSGATDPIRKPGSV